MGFTELPSSEVGSFLFAEAAAAVDAAAAAWTLGSSDGGVILTPSSIDLLLRGLGEAISLITLFLGGKILKLGNTILFFLFGKRLFFATVGELFAFRVLEWTVILSAPRMAYLYLSDYIKRSKNIRLAKSWDFRLSGYYSR